MAEGEAVILFFKRKNPAIAIYMEALARLVDCKKMIASIIIAGVFA
jgi:hypothetical protein